MAEFRHCRIWVDVELGRDPISGAIQADDGEQRPFVGWLGLISAIEALIAADRLAPVRTTATNRDEHSPVKQVEES